MAMRRPRIKAQANIQLNSKRKPKTADPKPTANTTDAVLTKEDNKAVGQLEIDLQKEQLLHHPPVAELGEVQPEGNAETEVRTNSNNNASDTNAASENNLKNAIVEGDNNEEAQPTNDIVVAVTKNSAVAGSDKNQEGEDGVEAFKCPPSVEYQRSVSHASHSGVDDVFYSDIEENALQMDLQRSPNEFPMSPSKSATRQRIKPTPVFGQRRNSFVGSMPSPNPQGTGEESPYQGSGHDSMESPQRRERHLSASMSVNSNASSSSHHYHPAHKYFPSGVVPGAMGRMRTESGCSVFSDTNVATSKNRKSEYNKFNMKRDYESRFMYGVPDKSCIKMSDLIYYNPATNPMELKANPNLKMEIGDNINIKSSAVGDIKPFKEKQENAIDTLEEAEAIPVPQLKLDSNGELILDDKSLLIETTAEQEARKVLANSSLIYLDENTGTNGFYSRQKRTRDWHSSETIKFYRCLQTVGTDFSLMVPLFPNRTRRDLKLKFKKEERVNGNLINKALLYPKQFNIEELKLQIEEEDRKREEEANRLKKLREINKTKEVKKRKYGRSSADVILNTNVYKNESDSTELGLVNQNTLSNDSLPLTGSFGETALNISNDTGEQDAAIASKQLSDVPKVKRRRKRAPNIIPKDCSATKSNDASQTIKMESIKNEPNAMATTEYPYYIVESNIPNPPSSHSENVYLDDPNMDLVPLPLSSSNVPITDSPVSMESCGFQQMENIFEVSPNADDSESRTFVNLDDGSVTTIIHFDQPRDCTAVSNEQAANVQPTPSPSPSPSNSPSPPTPAIEAPHSPECGNADTAVNTNAPDLIDSETCLSTVSDWEMSDHDIQQIMSNLTDGSLVLVSTIDPNDADKVLNEIYLVDKNTGDLCDEPLDIPDDIVQCILSVMS